MECSIHNRPKPFNRIPRQPLNKVLKPSVLATNIVYRYPRLSWGNFGGKTTYAVEVIPK